MLPSNLSESGMIPFIFNVPKIMIHNSLCMTIVLNVAVYHNCVTYSPFNVAVVLNSFKMNSPCSLTETVFNKLLVCFQSLPVCFVGSEWPRVSTRLHDGSYANCALLA